MSVCLSAGVEGVSPRARNFSTRKASIGLVNAPAGWTGGGADSRTGCKAHQSLPARLLVVK